MKFGYPIILELILCLLKFYICIKMLVVLGFLSVNSIFVYYYTPYFVIRLIGLEKINTNEILLLGTKPPGSLIAVVYFL
jgi:hypothetical protein